MTPVEIVTMNGSCRAEKWTSVSPCPLHPNKGEAAHLSGPARGLPQALQGELAHRCLRRAFEPQLAAHLPDVRQVDISRRVVLRYAGLQAGAYTRSLLSST